MNNLLSIFEERFITILLRVIIKKASYGFVDAFLKVTLAD